AGDKAFVSGTDIRQFLTFKTKDDALGYEARITRVLGRIANMTKPTIAMVGGDAVGGGMFMSLACDLRIVAEHARFGAPVARTLGNFAAPFSLGLLAATVGPVRAREIVLTARLVSAADAKTIGLVDEDHPAAALRRRAQELAAHLPDLAPLTLAATNDAVRRMILAAPPGSPRPPPRARSTRRGDALPRGHRPRGGPRALRRPGLQSPFGPLPRLLDGCKGLAQHAEVAHAINRPGQRGAGEQRAAPARAQQWPPVGAEDRRE